MNFNGCLLIVAARRDRKKNQIPKCDQQYNTSTLFVVILFQSVNLMWTWFYLFVIACNHVCYCIKTPIQKKTNKPCSKCCSSCDCLQDRRGHANDVRVNNLSLIYSNSVAIFGHFIVWSLIVFFLIDKQMSLYSNK